MYRLYLSSVIEMLGRMLSTLKVTELLASVRHCWYCTFELATHTI